MPHINDPLFNNSVIFICEHDEKGAMGLIINKCFQKKDLKELNDDINEESSEILNIVSNVYFGGPVLIERGILLHSEKKYSEQSIKVSDDFFISSDKKTLLSMLKNKKKINNRLFLGHSGWSSGQLENEIKNGDWLVQDTSPEFIFNVPAEQMWSIAFQSYGIDSSNSPSFGGQA
jgi:putative transcriptional regulator